MNKTNTIDIDNKTNHCNNKAEKEFQFLFMVSPEAIVVTDEIGKIQRINNAFSKLFQYSDEEIRGKNIDNIVAPRNLNKSIHDEAKTITHRITNGEKVSIEGTRYNKSGHPINVSILGSPLRINRTATVCYTIYRDLSRMEIALQQLKEKEEQLRVITSSTQDAIIAIDEHSNITFWNFAATKIFGFNEDEAVGSCLYSLIVPEKFHSKFVNRLEKFIQTGYSEAYGEIVELTAVMKGGIKFPIELTLSQAKYKNKLNIVLTIRDITKRKDAELEIGERERQLIESNSIPTYMIDNNHLIQHWNLACENLTGISAGDRINTDKHWSPFYKEYRWALSDYIVEGKTEEIRKVYGNKVKESDILIGAYEGEDFFPHLGADGLWLFYTAAPIRNINGEIVGAIETIQDITRRKRIEKELEKEQALFKYQFKSAPDALVITDINGKILRVNNHFCDLFSYQASEILKKKLDDIIAPISVDKEKNTEAIEFTNLVANGKTIKKETDRFNKNNQRIPVSILAKPVTINGKSNTINFIQYNYRDITQRKYEENRLQKSLSEKNNLLKEIHHRVKNNLQVVSTLLKLQSLYCDDQKTIDMFEDSRKRLITMAIIHAKLYSSETFSEVDFEDYTYTLVNDIFTSYGRNDINVKYEISIKEVYLDISTGINCALIINELVSNSLKHAFPRNLKKKNNKIRILMRYNRDKTGYVLTVSDNGIGIPDDFDIFNSSTLGLQIVGALVEQLEGKLSLIKHKKKEGTHLSIHFLIQSDEKD